MLLLPTVMSLLVAVAAQYDPTCLDQLPDCEKYGQDSCTKFPEWAKDKCKNTCHICVGPTKAPPPCVNKLNNCDQYGKQVCSDAQYKGWAEDNCRYYCRVCSSAELARVDAIVTTLSPSACVDRVNCREYTKTSCSGQYEHWAKENCPVFCGFCTGPATPQPACADALPDCGIYGANVCHDTHYKLWVEDNCRKYCGICGGGGVPTVAVGPATPGPIRPVIITPTPHIIVPGK